MSDKFKNINSDSLKRKFPLSDLGELMHEIFSALKHNKLRTTLTGLSVSWGIFILIVLLGAGNGLKNGVSTNFAQRAINTIQMWPGTTSKPFKGLKTNRSLNFSEKELNHIDESIKEKEDQTFFF